jgi:hypothetical protein
MTNIINHIHFADTPSFNTCLLNYYADFDMQVVLLSITVSLPPHSCQDNVVQAKAVQNHQPPAEPCASCQNIGQTPPLLHQ